MKVPWNSDDAVVEIRGLSKAYPNGVTALEDATFNIEQGQFVAVLGPSGAGKSTLLRCISGLISPSQGQLRVGDIQYDRTYETLKQIRRITGMVFQEFNLFGHLTVMHNVLMGRITFLPWWRWLSVSFSQEDKEIAYEALLAVGLAGKVYDRVNQLSGGQRQRVGIARAIVQEPILLLADEPVASLDPKTSCEILELLREICLKNNRTVICNLHQVEYGRTYSDRIIGLSDGHTVMDGKSADLSPEEIASIYGDVDVIKPDMMEPACVAVGT
jgi:phosphonate transport system ATP-binding protein